MYAVQRFRDLVVQSLTEVTEKNKTVVLPFYVLLCVLCEASVLRSLATGTGRAVLLAFFIRNVPRVNIATGLPAERTTPKAISLR
jgi:hypothetical protein